MHSEAEAFLQRIRAYPDDDAPRLIFADWLDEQGDPRGRFVRVQLALASLPNHDPARDVLAAEEQALLNRHRDEWEAQFRGIANGLVFRRGFVDEAKVAARTFLQHDAEIFAAAPVRHLHLLDIGSNLEAVLRSPFLSRLAAVTIHAAHAGEPLARAVARCPALAGLRKLALSRNRFADDAIEHLALCPHFANLEELDLSENEIGETGARALAGSPHLGNLRALELRGNRLGPAGAEAVAGSERLVALHYLGLSGNEVGGPRLASIPRAHALLRVPVLDLSANGLSATGLLAVLTRPPAEPAPVRLEEIDLSHNELGDDGARVLAECPYLAGLTRLRLAGCAIGDTGVRALANSPHLNRLAALDLTNNPANDPGFRAFRDTQHMRNLRRLLLPLGVSTGMRLVLDQQFNRPRRG